MNDDRSIDGGASTRPVPEPELAPARDAAPAIKAEPGPVPTVADTSPTPEATPEPAAPPIWRRHLGLLLLAGIMLLAGWLRFSGYDWDGDEHLHPDERFLTMVTGALSPPEDFLGYLDTDTSMLNPRNTGHAFYVYGTWPITLAFTVARLANAGDYSQVHLVGRQLNMLYDLLSVLLIYLIGYRLADRRTGLLAALLAAGTAFSIQQSHFFTVDIPANLFFLVFLYGFVRSLDGRFQEAEFGFRMAATGTVSSKRRSLTWRLGYTALAGVGMGMALASKIALWPMVPLAILSLVALAWRTCRQPLDLRRVVLPILTLGLTSFVTLRLCQPDMFAGPGWPNVQEDPARYLEVTAKAPEWWFKLAGEVPGSPGSVRTLPGEPAPLGIPDALKPIFLPDPRWAGNLSEIGRQIQGYGMDWPPNHQWWGRRDWLFPLGNMLLWGMGLPLGLTAVAAWFWVAARLMRGRGVNLLLPWLWSALVFGYYGQQWGKTMRYFLPIYPTLTILAAALLIQIWIEFRPTAATDLHALAELEPDVRPPRVERGLATLLLVGVAAGTVLWGFMFSRIYAREHSRVQASRWIYHHIPTAFGLKIAPDDASGRGAFLPAGAPVSLRFELGSYRYEAPEGGWLGPMPVLVVGEGPVRVDAAHLAHVASSPGGPARVSIQARLTDSDQLDAGGGPAGTPLASGEAAFDLSDIEQDLTVPFDAPAELEATARPARGPQGLARLWRQDEVPPPQSPGKRYWLWLRPDGAPLSGRTSIFAHDTSWDDTVPRGLDGYAPWDQADSDWPEGLFGFVQLQMYDEDKDPAKLEAMMDGLERADYLISTSNRVYGSTRQMPTRYPMTNRFYDILFGEEYGARHVASIHSFPSLGPIEVDDQGAEEAFHVYDHPQVDIWATDGIDPVLLRGDLAPRQAEYAWVWPSDQRSFRDRYLPFLPRLGDGGGAGGSLEGDGSGAGSGPLARLLARITGPPAPPDAAAARAEAEEAARKLLLSPERAAAERERGDYLFDPDGLFARAPALALVAWYALLAFIGLALWPFAAHALPNLADRGWSIARAAGLLLVSWSAWLIASLGVVDHKPPLLWACLLGLALAAWVLPGRRRARELLAFLRAERRTVLGAELLFALLFLAFLGIRYGNPDLWHPWYGGEKPMDFAYLNATLRAVSFPPADPWFAGGALNYYYFGFVFVGALFELSLVPPWIGYNLAIPSLAAMTGLGVAGVVHNWSRAQGIGVTRSRVAAVLGAGMAVLMGNLYQVPFILGKAVESLGMDPAAGGAGLQSRIPGAALAVNGARSLARLALDPIQAINIPTGHWYWNASRAIPEQGETVAITEMPFFTFVYADLHAHMMALPLTVLALACALSWALPTLAEVEGRWWLEPWGLARLFLAALAIGALWPANTWDYPTYGLVAAGALGVGRWQSAGGPGPRWLWAVAWRGLLLLGLSLLLFLPYHRAYVTPYAEFSWWQSSKTPPGAFLAVHGIFLWAILAWALVRLDDALARAQDRRAVLRLLLGSALAVGLGMAYVWQKTVDGSGNQATYPPSAWTAVLGGLLLTLGVTLVFVRRQSPAQRLAAWILLLGAFLSQFVEYGVLAGDIGRMNTVFKFYIQLWVLWASLAAFAFAWLTSRWAERGTSDALGPRVWRTGFALLVAAGFVYTVTAGRGKVLDRFPPLGSAAMAEAESAGPPDPSLSGMAYMDHAYYEDGDNYNIFGRGAQSRFIALRHDRDAMLWLMENADGAPVVLEAYHPGGGYRWGSRYSIYTGLPTIIGWDWHQTQQRNAGGRAVIDARTADVLTLYSGTDDATARQLLAKYGVEYVVVGELERALYPAEGLGKFERWVEEGTAERVYESPPDMKDSLTGEPAVRIYRLRPDTVSGRHPARADGRPS